MPYNIFRYATLKVSREIKSDETLLKGQLRYYRYLLENIDLETIRINEKIKEVKEKRKREELENDRKIDTLLEERRRIVIVSDRRITELLKEKSKKDGQFEIAPKKIEELKTELKDLDSKRGRLMTEPRIKKLIKLQVELKEIGLFK